MGPDLLFLHSSDRAINPMLPSAAHNVYSKYAVYGIDWQQIHRITLQPLNDILRRTS